MYLWFLYLLLTLAFAVTIATVFFVTSSIIAFGVTRVPFAPTPKRNVGIVIEKLNLKPGEIFYDLGCGDGRYLIAAEQRGARATGFEISPWPFLKAKLNLKRHRSAAALRYQNFYSVNLGDADVVVCFLLDTVMEKVEKKLERELKPGARVASYGFRLPSWQPIEVVDLKPNSRRFSRIYLYKKQA